MEDPNRTCQSLREGYEACDAERLRFTFRYQRGFILSHTLFLLSIDYAVMEKSKEIYTLLAEFGWSDLGSWGSLRTLLPQDEAGKVKVGKDIRLYECKNCVVHAADESKVVVQGLDGYIIAEKHVQLLVCSLKEEQRIKEFEK